MEYCRNRKHYIPDRINRYRIGFCVLSACFICYGCSKYIIAGSGNLQLTACIIQCTYSNISQINRSTVGCNRPYHIQITEVLSFQCDIFCFIRMSNCLTVYIKIDNRINLNGLGCFKLLAIRILCFRSNGILPCFFKLQKSCIAIQLTYNHICKGNFFTITVCNRPFNIGLTDFIDCQFKRSRSIGMSCIRQAQTHFCVRVYADFLAYGSLYTTPILGNADQLIVPRLFECNFTAVLC